MRRQSEFKIFLRDPRVERFSLDLECALAVGSEDVLRSGVRGTCNSTLIHGENL